MRLAFTPFTNSSLTSIVKHQAMIQWDMIQEGDRLLLGLSGGKDSLSLLHCLLEFQRKLPIKFEIEVSSICLFSSTLLNIVLFSYALNLMITIAKVCTIDPMTPSFDPSPLIPYVEGLGLKYHYIRDDSEFTQIYSMFNYQSLSTHKSIDCSLSSVVQRASSSGKDGKTVSSLCAFCARMKRGNLYTCARKNNCNKLVLGELYLRAKFISTQ